MPTNLIISFMMTIFFYIFDRRQQRVKTYNTSGTLLNGTFIQLPTAGGIKYSEMVAYNGFLFFTGQDNIIHQYNQTTGALVNQNFCTGGSTYIGGVFVWNGSNYLVSNEAGGINVINKIGEFQWNRCLFNSAKCRILCKSD